MFYLYLNPLFPYYSGISPWDVFCVVGQDAGSGSGSITDFT